MPLSFETKTMTVGELFSGSNVFRMPIFQRPYSWEEETALELFGDIHQRWNGPIHQDAESISWGQSLLRKTDRHRLRWMSSTASNASSLFP